MSRFYGSPVWKIFAGARYSNCRYLFPIFIPHLLAALLEGGSFALIYLGFSALEGKVPENHFGFSFLSPEKWNFHLTQMETFYFYIFSAIALQAIRGLISFLALYGTSSFSLRVQTAAQKQVYEQIFKFSFPFVSQYKIGDLAEYAKTPSVFIPTLFEAVNRFSVSIFMCFGLIGVLYWISPMLTLLTFLLFGTFAFCQKVLLKKVLHHSGRLTDHLFEFSHHTVQSLQGIRPIHIFQKQNYILSKIENVLNLVVLSSKKVHFWNNLIPTINETVNVLLVGAVLILGSILLASNGAASLPNLLTYVALTYRLGTRLHIAMSTVGSIGIHYGSVLRLNDILEDNGKEYISDIEKEFSGWSDKIEFQKVGLRYPKSKKAALIEVSFSIPKGRTVAIVGLSGAGKSSLLDLFLGLQKPTSGDIFVDGQSLSSFSPKSWRQHVGVVSQETFIFNGTIEENIRFGDFDKTDEQIKIAAAQAGALDFIERLPETYKTVVGERGYKLSGGERQRLSLARALLRNPEILVLDEFTSNLDTLSERLIQASIHSMEKSKTIIVVAHRLSTIVHADEIIVLEHGRIIEQGSHNDLLSLKGRYATLWQLQSNQAMPNDAVYSP